MLSIRAPSTWSKSVSLIAFYEMLLQPFLWITGRLKKVIDLVDLFFKQGQILRCPVKFLTICTKASWFSPGNSGQNSLKDFIL